MEVIWRTSVLYNFRILALLLPAKVIKVNLISKQFTTFDFMLVVWRSYFALWNLPFPNLGTADNVVYYFNRNININPNPPKHLSTLAWSPPPPLLYNLYLSSLVIIVLMIIYPAGFTHGAGVKHISECPNHFGRIKR